MAYHDIKSTDLILAMKLDKTENRAKEIFKAALFFACGAVCFLVVYLVTP